MSEGADAVAAKPLKEPQRGFVITVLGVTQILAWGSSYYLPAVLASPIAADTGWSLTWVVGGLSLGLLLAGLVSPYVGAMIDRHGGRPILAASALLLALGQLGLGVAHSLAVYIAAWLVIGVGMGAGLYDAAFGTLGRLYGRGARSAITTLTLFGGLASTVCWPVSAVLVEESGWRGACFVYSAIQLLVALPLYLVALPREQKAANENRITEGLEAGRNPALPLLLLLAVTLTLAAFLSSTLSVHLLTILQERGMTLAAAVGLGAIVGPCQVGARAIELVVARYHHPIWTKAASVWSVAVGIGLLWTGGFTPIALVFYGAGIGLESIARGTLPLALFGERGYARLMGRLAMPSLLVQAAAPSIGALLLEAGSGNEALAALFGVAAVNVALVGLLLFAMRQHRA